MKEIFALKNSSPFVPMLEHKPFLRWAGSKRKQLARLAEFWTPDHTRYIEPFAGSACLFFKLCPEQAILGDNNKDLIELYRVVRDDPARLYTRLCRITRTLETYQRWRALDPKTLDRETRALRFLFLNRNCFNGIYRTNTQGKFNVPMGKKPGAYFTKEELEVCASLLNRAKLVAGDFSKTLQDVQKGDFVYLDPPYAMSARRMFREYGKQSFDTIDIPRFSKALKVIDRSGADFLVSYADCSEARGVAREWASIRLPIKRNVAGFAGDRKMAYEWLITNMNIPSPLRKGDYA